MKKVLVVAYAFPPVGGAGVQRVAKFSKYLGEFGWEPVLLTVKNPSVPAFDANQIKDVPADCRIYRTRTFEPSYKFKVGFSKINSPSQTNQRIKKALRNIQHMLMMPDPQILWWPGLFISLVRIVRIERINCLFVTAPPFSALVPVVFVGKMLGLPVVADFRDDWHFSRLYLENASKSAFAIKTDMMLERYVVSKCSALTVATASYVRHIYDRNPSVNRNKGHVITNGFDGDDFKGFSMEGGTDNSEVRVTFVYCGTVWKATSLLPFIKAVKALFKKYPNLESKISVKVFGRVVQQEMESLQKHGIEKNFVFEGYVPHNTSIKAMCAADILLLTLSDLPGSDQIIPGKTFEYMATGKHILAIVPEGETSRLLKKEYSNATVIHPKEGEAISQRILGLVRDKRNTGKNHKIDISQYERRSLTEKLAKVFSGLTESAQNRSARSNS